MPRFEVTRPDGKRIEVTAPEGATVEDAIAFVASTYEPEPLPGESGLDLGSITGPRTREGAGQALAEGATRSLSFGLAPSNLFATPEQMARNPDTAGIGRVIGAIPAARGLLGAASRLSPMMNIFRFMRRRKPPDLEAWRRNPVRASSPEGRARMEQMLNR